MADEKNWIREAMFYHIYPLGFTGAPLRNEGEATAGGRILEVLDWIEHFKELGINAIYFGPIFESVSHGYDTTDYYQTDSRLGSKEDFKKVFTALHENGIRVIVDGVFNHVGRKFFAFLDVQKNLEQSDYKDWFCNLNFSWQSPLGDSFSYENWHGAAELVKLNLRNPAVCEYLLGAVGMWMDELGIDGLRLDAADCVDREFFKQLHSFTKGKRGDFWLMGEVIHGDYSRWVNGETLHSVTNYALHKALYSGHNDHNYFEIAHTVKYLQNMGNLDLYNFVDNHDVERIYTKLSNKAHFTPVHILLYTLPGVPSIYYGSEFGIEGRKERSSDDSLRPALSLDDYETALGDNPCTALIAALGQIRQHTPALSYGSYAELHLTNRQFAFARDLNDVRVVVTVNNDDNAASMDLPAGNAVEYIGALSGQKVAVQDGRINVTVPANSGEIWVPAGDMPEYKPFKVEISVKEETVTDEESIPADSEAPSSATEPVHFDPNKSPEDMTVEELQAGILAKMANNGPVSDQMKKTVNENIWHDSLVNWLKSFR